MGSTFNAKPTDELVRLKRNVQLFSLAGRLGKTKGKHKMQLRPIKSNMTELTVGDTKILFSYFWPVAGYDDQGAFRTDQYFSVTTSRHINHYLGGKNLGRTVSQDYINSLVEVA
jgi:hypothetical protein